MGICRSVMFVWYISTESKKNESIINLVVTFAFVLYHHTYRVRQTKKSSFMET